MVLIAYSEKLVIAFGSLGDNSTSPCCGEGLGMTQVSSGETIHINSDRDGISQNPCLCLVKMESIIRWASFERYLYRIPSHFF
jgi:hypothetical protein